jgi:hypothetical protein
LHSRIPQQIEANGRRLKVIELQNELERLDREWKSQEVMIDGILRSYKDRKDMLLLAFPVSVAGLIMLVVGLSDWNVIMILLSVIPLFGAWFVFRSVQSAARELKVLENLEVAYQMRRLELVDAIESARREASA